MKYALIFIALLFCVGCNGASENAESAILTQNLQERAQEHNFALITAAQLHDVLNSAQNELNIDVNSLQIISASPRGVYILGFIKGTKNAPFSTESSGIFAQDSERTQEEFMDFLGDKNNSIVFYDNGEGSALNALLWAQKLGYKNVYYMFETFKTWRKNGYEISFDMPECCKI